MESDALSDPIRFRCVRCQHPAQAPSDKVGQRMYCPVCYYVLTVPNSSTIRPLDPLQVYQADEVPIDARDLLQQRSSQTIRCTRCNTLVVVPPGGAGRNISCPECETEIAVPETFFSEAGAKKEKKVAVRSGDIYAVHKNGASLGRDELIPVYCKLCNTLMHGTEKQVGTKLLCPDCGTETIVLPKIKRPTSVAAGQTSYEGTTTFGLNVNGTGNSATGPTGNTAPQRTEPLVPVICSLCATRMYAGKSEIGSFKTCPDCGRKNEVCAVPDREMYIPTLETGGYAVDREPPAPRPAFRVVQDYRYVEGSLDKDAVDPPKSSRPMPSSRRLPQSTGSDVDPPKSLRPMPPPLPGIVRIPFPPTMVSADQNQAEPLSEQIPQENPFWSRIVMDFQNRWTLLRFLGISFTAITILISTQLSGFFFHIGMVIGLISAFFFLVICTKYHP